MTVDGGPSRPTFALLSGQPIAAAASVISPGVSCAGFRRAMITIVSDQQYNFFVRGGFAQDDPAPAFLYEGTAPINRSNEPAAANGRAYMFDCRTLGTIAVSITNTGAAAGTFSAYLTLAT